MNDYPFSESPYNDMEMLAAQESTLVRRPEPSPFASDNSPYPLLTAWYYGRLQAEWCKTQRALIESDLKLSPIRAGELAAARLAVWISQEYAMFAAEVNRRVRAVSNPDYSDVYTDFYDALQDESLPTYRGVLQDVSGTRTMLLDEQDYLAELDERK